MNIEIISLDEMIEEAYDKERDTEDEQTFVSASLSFSPDEDVKRGWYNGKPKDLVSLFRENDGEREEEE